MLDIQRYRREPTHPGQFLLEEFAKPLGLTQKVLADKLGTQQRAISELYNKKRGVSPLMALKLAKLLGTTPEFWLNAQMKYDLYKSYQRDQEQVEKVEPVNNDACEVVAASA